jgi:hypothetical protein
LCDDDDEEEEEDDEKSLNHPTIRRRRRRITMRLKIQTLDSYHASKLTATWVAWVAKL